VITAFLSCTYVITEVYLLLMGLIDVAVLESELQYKISEYMDVMKDISNLKALFSSINS
jgi:hypothetical protein